MVWLSLSPYLTHGSDFQSDIRHVQHTQWVALRGETKQCLEPLLSLPLSPPPQHIILTLAVIRDVHHSTLAADTEHWVGVLNVAHEQLVVVEHPGWAVNHLGGADEPGASDPWIATERKPVSSTDVNCCDL